MIMHRAHATFDIDQLSLEDQIEIRKLCLIRNQYIWFRKEVVKAIDHALECKDRKDPYSFGDILSQDLFRIFREDNAFIKSLDYKCTDE